MDVFVARQPIFDRDKVVIAYELLYREGDANYFNASVSDNIATSVLLMNSYLSFGMNALIGELKAFINFSKALINNDIPLLLNENNVVVELLESIKPDPFFINKIKELKKKGYIIALDDYAYGYEYIDLIELSDIIKIDFMQNTKSDIQKFVSEWKEKGKLLLAEKVETLEEFIWAKNLGFDYFQGYFFSKPMVLKNKTLSNSSFQYFNLMDKLSVDEPNYKEIANIIEKDVNLTYKLLKLVNSRFTLNQSINSIQHALSILGINSFRKWLSLAIIQNNLTSGQSELVKISLIRSSFVEKIAMASNLKMYASELSLLGILSLIDVLLEAPMKDLLDNLSLSVDITNTLLGHKTKYSCIIKIITEYEKGQFNDIAECCREINVNKELLPHMYIEAVKWAEDLFEYMQ